MSRNRFFAQNGGEKALNRCEVPVLQREDLERTAKAWPCSSQTVGYGWVGICGVGCENLRRFEDSKMAYSNRQCFGCEKDLLFQLMQSQPIKKSFFSAQRGNNFPPHPN